MVDVSLNKQKRQWWNRNKERINMERSKEKHFTLTERERLQIKYLPRETRSEIRLCDCGRKYVVTKLSPEHCIFCLRRKNG